MIGKIKWILSIGMVGVLGIGAFFIYNTVEERNELLQKNERFQQQIQQCENDQKQLKELVEEYQTKIEEQQKRQKQLQQKNQELQKEYEEKQKELQNQIEKIDEETIENGCQNKIDWLKEKAIHETENNP